MASVKTLLRSTLNKVGLDIVRTKNQHGDQAAHLRNVIASRGIDCVVDIGANAGQYGEFLRRIGFEGQIVSFEPVSAVFETLREKAERDGRWTCHNLALGDAKEEKVLNVYSSTVFSSFLDANDYAKGIWRSLEKVEPQKVEVARLDDVYQGLVASLGVERVLLKLDTQGYDLHVFRGAKASLRHVEALQSELSLIPVYEGGVNGYDLLAAFQKEGFHVSGLYPINRDASLAVIEFDCVLVKRQSPA